MKQLHFYVYNKINGYYEYLKSWPNWSGEIPQAGDFVVLHFGDNNEEECVYRVDCRVINGTLPNKVRINVTSMMP